MNRIVKISVSALLICALYACGGSSGGTAAGPPVNQPPSTGAATLQWTPPTANSDGSTLVDLTGYKIYQSQTNSEASLQLVATLSTPGLASYMVEGLSAGTYYFSVTAYNSSNLESDYSNLVSVTVN